MAQKKMMVLDRDHNALLDRITGVKPEKKTAPKKAKK